MEDGFKLWIENEKNVEKLAGNCAPGCRNLMGFEYMSFPTPEFGTPRSRVSLTLPLVQWASPRSFTREKVSVPKSNSVADEISPEETVSRMKGSAMTEANEKPPEKNAISRF